MLLITRGMFNAVLQDFGNVSTPQKISPEVLRADNFHTTLGRSQIALSHVGNNIR